MTNQEIEDKLDEAVRNERQITREILQLILLAEERKLYLERGKDSMVRWLIERYRYSETAAIRRVQAARLLKAVPDVDLKIQSGQVNLTTLAKAQGVLRAEEKRIGETISSVEKAEVIGVIEGQSEFSTDKKLAQRFPESVKRITQQHTRVVADDCVRLSVTLPQETYDLLLEVRDLLGHVIPEGELPAVIHRVCADFKSRKSPRNARSLTARCDTGPVSLSVKARHFVFTRDKGQCQFRDSITGEICGSRRRIEIDHIVPKALGGSNDVDNLRCLCRLHNAYRAEKTFGKYR